MILKKTKQNIPETQNKLAISMQSRRRKKNHLFVSDAKSFDFFKSDLH